MSELTGILLDLFIIYLAAKLAAEVFERIRQPAVIGELLAGLAIGPHALGFIGTPDAALVAAFHGDAAAAAEGMQLVYHVLAELGVVVLLFFVGLETRVADILRVGRRAALVAVLGVILPFALGYAFVGPVLGHPTTEASFVAAAMVATSVGITARVLRDLGVIRSAEARIILGAAVIDDILAMIILAVVVGMASTGGISTAGIALIAAQAFGFTLFAVLVGAGLVRRYALRLDRLRMDGAPLAVALLAMLGLATASASVGLAAIIGAFLAGMVFAEAREHFLLERQALPIYQFLVPFFFVLTGSNVDWRLFTDPGTLGIALAVTALALAGKLAGGGAGMLGTGRRSMAIVGVGMAPRGEVGLIVAGIGFSLGAIPSEVFGVVVVMSVLTTVVVPPALKLLYRGQPVNPALAGDVTEQAGHLSGL